ncbi:MAG: tetratricopeptide repeat protein [Armatimonadetes bacterium]|nr:tetratricopeptide repeat protein [Armatimonadota bacterium]
MRSLYLVGLLLVIITVAVYWPVLRHDFTNYDDDKYVTDNPPVQAGLTAPSIVWAFTKIHESNWHPLTWLSHMLDAQLYGPNPMGHHLTNLVFHVANVVLLFSVLMLMTGCVWRSGFVAALFAIHPLHVESVAWIAERKDVLSTFFWLLTMLAYFRYASSPRLGTYLPVVILFALGLMSKPMLVTLPFVLLLMDYWPLGRTTFSSNLGLCVSGGVYGTHKAGNLANGRKSGKGFVRFSENMNLLREKTPLFLMTLVSCVITFYAQKKQGSVQTFEFYPFGVRIANAFAAYSSYIRKTLWPNDLACFYPHPGRDLAMWKVLWGFIVLASISYFVWRLASRRPYLVVGWLWYLGTLVPVIGLVQVGMQAMADRYTYIPLIGLFIAIAWGIPELTRRKSNSDGKEDGRQKVEATVFPFAACIAIVALMIGTWFQVGYWKNSITLFERALAVTENNDTAHNNLGIALAWQGRLEEAIPHYKRALEISPMYGDAHGNLANAYAQLGMYDDAIREYKEVLKLNPNDPRAYYNMGNVLAAQGKAKEALQNYSRALGIKQDDAGAHLSIGKMLADQGKYDEALAEYKKAIELKPSFAEAHYNMGLALKRLGRFDEAIKAYREAIRYKPEYPEALNNLGNVLLLQKKYDEAIKEYKRAIRIRPDHAEAHHNLAAAYFYKGEYAKAWEEIHLCKRYGFNPVPALLNSLSQKMPDPGE